jgi:hypothetical protein
MVLKTIVLNRLKPSWDHGQKSDFYGPKNHGPKLSKDVLETWKGADFHGLKDYDPKPSEAVLRPVRDRLFIALRTMVQNCLKPSRKHGRKPTFHGLKDYDSKTSKAVLGRQLGTDFLWS